MDAEELRSRQEQMERRGGKVNKPSSKGSP